MIQRLRSPSCHTNSSLALFQVVAVTKLAAVGIVVVLDAHILKAAQSLKHALNASGGVVTYVHGTTTISISYEEYVVATKPLTSRMAAVAKNGLENIWEHFAGLGRSLLKGRLTALLVGGSHMDGNLERVLADLLRSEYNVVKWVSPKSVREATEAVAKGAAYIAACHEPDAPWELMFQDVNPEPLRMLVVPSKDNRMVNSIPIIEGGMAFGVWYKANNTFVNKQQAVGPGTVIQVFNFSQGYQKDFWENTFVGSAELTYEDIKDFLGDAQHLEAYQLRFYLSTKIMGTGNMLTFIDVYDIVNGVSLKEITVKFESAGAISFDLRDKLIREAQEAVFQTAHDSILAEITEAIEGHTIPKDVQRRLDTSLASPDKLKDTEPFQRVLAEVLRRRVPKEECGSSAPAPASASAPVPPPVSAVTGSSVAPAETPEDGGEESEAKRVCKK